MFGLQLLDRRLPEKHEMKEQIRSKMQAAKAGVHGEVRVANVFEKYSFPFEYVVLHDVSLESYGRFQIDTVLLTEYFVALLESKNIGGKLRFKQNPPQLERENDEGKIDVFENPEVQVERNAYLFEEWLRLRGMRIPIYGVIVLTNSKVMVIESPVKYPAILHSTIPVFIRNIPRKKMYLKEDEIHRLTEKIVASHQTYFPYPMCGRWGINPQDLLTGVHCEKCDTLGMEKKKNGWNCPKCGYVNRHAHEKAIREWFVLIGESINNRQCRYFLRLDSHHVASRILKSMKVDRVGTSNNTVAYKWKW